MRILDSVFTKISINTKMVLIKLYYKNLGFGDPATETDWTLSS